MYRILPIAFAAAAFAVPASAFTIVTTLDAKYFTVTSGGAGDFQTQCCSVRPNMVADMLGANGLPVFTADGGPTILGTDGVTGEIQWWTAGVTNGGDTVSAPLLGSVDLPFSDSTFFPPDGTGVDNANGYLTAAFSGTFDLASHSLVTANIGADDDAFVFINGKLLAGLGGVHRAIQAPVGSLQLTAGTHQVDVFYADRFRSKAELNLSLEGAVVPEPATWAMLIAGFGMVGFAARRRRAAITAA